MKIKEAFVGIINAISTKINLKLDIISDLDTIRAGAALGLTSIQDLGSITGIIPELASSENQLADKAFVNSSINTATATFIGTYNLVTDLSLSVDASLNDKVGALNNLQVLGDTPNLNDYCYIQIPTSSETTSEILKVERYKHNGTTWAYEYELNNSGFTSALWLALNSNITSSLVSKLSDLPTNAALLSSLAGKLNVISDLESIRSGSQAGATALQSFTETDPTVPSHVKGITQENLSNWNDANDKKHTHTNKAVLDGITSEKVTSWDNKYDKPGTGIPASDLEQSVLDSLEYILNNRSTTEKFDTINKLTEPGKKGIAHIEKISGNTVVWNQLLRKCAGGIWEPNDVTNIEWLSTTNGVKYTPTARYGRVASQVIAFIKDHIYYIKVEVTALSAFQMYIYGGPRITGGTFNLSANKNNIAVLSTAVQSGTSRLTFQDNRASNWDEITIVNPQLFDLTLIYGEGNEPSTPAQFEADYQRWFGKPLTYEPYNEGELIPVKMTGLKTTGFNQWDGVFEKGRIDGNDGSDIASSYYQRTTYIKALPNTTYYYKAISEQSNDRIVFYDSQRSFIGVSQYLKDTTFTTPVNCAFVRLQVNYNNQSETDHTDVGCINLSWSGVKDGTYEPYKEHTLPFDVTTLQGKLNGEGELVTPFADGMKSTGSVHDEIINDNGVWKAIKRVGSVDLGSLTWYKAESVIVSGYYYFRATINTIASQNTGILPNVKCPYYTPVRGSKMYNGTAVDKSIAGEQPNFIRIHDTAYDSSDETIFKTAMSGVILYYELAEPLVYELEYNGNIIKSIDYLIKEYGVETLIVPSGGIAADITVKYNDSVENRVNDTIIDLASTITDLGFGEVSYDYGVLSFTPNDNVRNEIIISESDYESLLEKDSNTIYNII